MNEHYWPFLIGGILVLCRGIVEFVVYLNGYGSRTRSASSLKHSWKYYYWPYTKNPGGQQKNFRGLLLTQAVGEIILGVILLVVFYRNN